MQTQRYPDPNNKKSTKPGMTEWQGLLLCIGIIFSMLLIFILCLGLGSCGRQDDVCVFDEWYDGVRRLDRHGSDERLSQMEGARLDYDFGIEFVGVYVGERDDPRFGLCYWSDIDMLVVYCFDTDETYTYDPDTNTLRGTVKNSAALDELMDIYFTSASAEGKKKSAFSADAPGTWTFEQSNDPTLDAIAAQHAGTETD